MMSGQEFGSTITLEEQYQRWNLARYSPSPMVSVRNAVNGFQAAGIHPYDPQRYTPDDYFGC